MAGATGDHLQMLAPSAATSMTAAEPVRFTTFGASMNSGAKSDLLGNLWIGDDVVQFLSVPRQPSASAELRRPGAVAWRCCGGVAGLRA